MEKEKSKNRGFIFVEILLLSAIAIIAASLVLRFVYAKEMKNWEDNLWLSFGVHPLLGRFFVGIIVIVTVVFINIKKKKERNHKRLHE